MSPNCNKLSISMKKSSSSVHGHGSPGSRDHGNDRNQPPSCSSSIAHNFDTKRYNNQPLKVYLVIPGEPNLTQALLLYMIPSNRFVVGSQTENTHNTIKQTVFSILVTSLSTIFNLKSKVKQTL